MQTLLQELGLIPLLLAEYIPNLHLLLRSSLNYFFNPSNKSPDKQTYRYC